MKKVIFSLLVTALAFPFLTQALLYDPGTIFLKVDNKVECEAQGAFWDEYGDCVTSFSDISFEEERHPHLEAIKYVRKENIVSGYPDGTYRPDATINRVELIKIVREANPKPADCETGFSFTDVPQDTWYGSYLDNAVCRSIVGGYPDGSFKPGNPVTVAEAAKIIANGLDLPVTETGGAWYEGFVNSLAARGALPTQLNGVGAELTRGQMAEMIYRLKTGNTNLSSHTLSSLAAGVAPMTEAQVLDEVDAELDDLFDDVFSEDGLDLDSLLDF